MGFCRERSSREGNGQLYSCTAWVPINERAGAPIPNGLVSSGLGLEAPSQTAEHDTGSLKSHASRLTDQPPDNRDTSGCCPLAGAGHLVVVKVQDAVSDIVTTGTAQCPFTAYSNPKTHEAPPPCRRRSDRRRPTPWPCIDARPITKRN